MSRLSIVFLATFSVFLLCNATVTFDVSAYFNHCGDAVASVALTTSAANIAATASASFTYGWSTYNVLASATVLASASNLRITKLVTGNPPVLFSGGPNQFSGTVNVTAVGVEGQYSGSLTACTVPVKILFKTVPGVCAPWPPADSGSFVVNATNVIASFQLIGDFNAESGESVSITSINCTATVGSATAKVTGLQPYSLSGHVDNALTAVAKSPIGAAVCSAVVQAIRATYN